MNGRVADVAEVRRLGQALADHPAWARVVVCAPATLLYLVHRALEGCGARAGAQDCHAELAGPLTGALSAEMLADAGAEYVLLGHSERRLSIGETNAQVAKKALAAWRARLTPIVCVGETVAQRTAGRAVAAVRRQVRGSCPSALGAPDFAVAYEPVWAIGSGRTPEPAEIAEVHAAVRAQLVAAFGPAGERAPVLYGGSVDVENAREILLTPGVDGLLVGRASLRCHDFLPIIRQADAIRPPVGG